MDRGFQSTPYDRMQAALRECDASEPASPAWAVMLPLISHGGQIGPPSSVGQGQAGPSSAGSAADASSLTRDAVALMNASQQRAVATSLRQPVSLLHGPPGTGKTTTLAHAVHAALLEATRSKILLLAETNNAVDNLVSAVLRSCDRCASPLASGELVRVGSTDLVQHLFI